MSRRKKPVALPPPWAPWAEWVLRLDKIYRHDDKFIEPLSERWRQARRGRLTASVRAAPIYHRRPKTWNTLMDKLDTELAPDYQWEEIEHVDALNWGRKYESAALANIELRYGEEITEPGMLFHRDYPFVAATPDGLAENGEVSVEIKCPKNPDVHLKVLYGRTISSVYLCQVQWAAWVAGTQRIQFYSYDPRQPAASQLARVDIPVDEKMLDTFATNMRDFATLFNDGKRLTEGKTRLASIPDFF